MTAWYRTGTVTATNGSETVTGALTAWLANAKVGDLWVPDTDGRGYEITAVSGNTSIEIFPAYAGTTGAGKAYGIARISPNWNSVSEISVSLAELVAAQTNILAGSGVPADSLGNDGDVYFRQDVAEYYVKGSGTWSLVTSLIGPEGPAGPSFQGTSTTSLTIGTGSKTFTTQTSRGYTVGQRLRAASTASASNYMEGIVASYSSTTLVLTVDRVGGSGTIASWTINIAGDVGPANSLAIGSVTTGAAGSSASASITGTAPSQTLNLTIPRGNTGVQGETGPQGVPGDAATVEVGTVDTLDPGDPATVTNSGTSSEAVFDFGIPQGEPGTPINHTGDYNAGTTYNFNDAVRELGSTWVYINDTPASGNPPPTLPTTSNSHWELLAQAGSNGTGAVDLVNGQSGTVVLTGSSIETNHNAVNYLPAGTSIADHVAAIDTVLGDIFTPGAAPDATIASAATVDIGASAGLMVEITGSTTITSFGTVANQWRYVRFAGALTLTHNGTSLILPGAINKTTQAGDMAEFVSDASGNWRCVMFQEARGWNFRIREVLIANRNYYVRTDGSDTLNDGLTNTSGGAFLTIQKAANVAAALDTSIYTVTINVGAGTFAEQVTLKRPAGGGRIQISGAGATTIIDPPAGVNHCFQAITGGEFQLTNMKLQKTTATTGHGILVQNNALVYFSGIEFGAFTPSGRHIFANQGGIVVCQGAYTITGNAIMHYCAQSGGLIQVVNQTVTLTGTPAFSSRFADVFLNGSIQVNGATFTGSATGTRYLADMLGAIWTNGGGATFLPGNVNGSVTNGGIYA